MATFGAIASANPNVLFDPAAAMGAAQAYKRNDLMMQNAQQDQQAETFQRDATARIGLARQMADLPDDVLAKEWGPAVQRMQQAGLGQGLDPATPPPRERLQQIASSDLTTFQKMQGEHLARQDAEQSRYHDGTLGMQQAHLNQTAAHQAASLGLQGASLAETRRHHQATLAQQERLAGGEGVALAPGSDPAAPRMVTDKNGLPITRGLTEGQVWGVAPDGQRVAMPIPGFTPPAKPERPPPAAPVSVQGNMLENVNALRQVDTALGALDENKGEGIGWKGYLPGPILNRIDPAGVALRAQIADIGSLKLHDRSGASVTASESPRLQPFIPSATDDEKTARTKLEKFRREYEAVLRDQYEAAGPAGGMRALPPVERALERTQGGQRPASGERPPLSSFGR